MPLIRRIPKRGFNNVRHGTEYIPVNVGVLDRFDDGVRVDEVTLRSLGLVNGSGDGIKVLAQGELKKKITIVANAFSAAARSKIEAAGGQCELIQK